jgi:hypothetical protein
MWKSRPALRNRADKHCKTKHGLNGPIAGNYLAQPASMVDLHPNKADKTICILTETYLVV